MDDLISRQDAILALLEKGQRSRRYKLGEIWELNFDEIREALATVPSAEPVRHGKWTADEILYTQGMTACSCCKTEYYRDDLYMVGNNAQGELPNYCPNCGARMDKE